MKEESKKVMRQAGEQIKAKRRARAAIYAPASKNSGELRLKVLTMLEEKHDQDRLMNRPLRSPLTLPLFRNEKAEKQQQIHQELQQTLS